MQMFIAAILIIVKYRGRGWLKGGTDRAVKDDGTVVYLDCSGGGDKTTGVCQNP